MKQTLLSLTFILFAGQMLTVSLFLILGEAVWRDFVMRIFDKDPLSNLGALFVFNTKIMGLLGLASIPAIYCWINGLNRKIMAMVIANALLIGVFLASVSSFGNLRLPRSTGV